MFRAVRRWFREHPRIVDGAVAGAVFAYNLPVLAGFIPGNLSHAAVYAVSAAWSAGLCLPYVFRRDRPALTFAVMALAAFAQLPLGIIVIPADVMLVLGLYNVAARCSRRTSLTTTAVAWFGGAVAVLRWGGDPAAELVTATVFVGSVWIWGYTIGTRRAYLASLEERAVRLARERDNQARIAAAAERARIAREMHDVVSHSLSVIVVQADGAAYSVRTGPERAEQALATIGDTGRGALAEMRRMLGVLRDDGEAEDDDLAPQPGTAQLDRLVEDARRSGLPVESAVAGTPRALPTGMELAAYRIVQEALTNVRKHGGPGVRRVQVRLWYGESVLEIRVSDDGRGATAPPDPDGGGHGLVGMRERAAAYGGSVHSGPQPGGGFAVVVYLPLDE